MNLADLNKIDVKDLKNIDYGHILQELRKKPLAVVNVVLVLGTLIFCQQYYSKKKKESDKAASLVPELEKKIEAITAYQQTKKELDSFMDNIPDFLADEELISFIADLAEKRRVRIRSFSPGKVVNLPLSDRFNVAFEVQALSYQDLWLFIHDLEVAPYSLSVMNLTVNMPGVSAQSNRSRRRNTQEEEQVPGGLAISLEINSVDVKKDAK